MSKRPQPNDDTIYPDSVTRELAIKWAMTGCVHGEARYECSVCGVGVCWDCALWTRKVTETLCPRCHYCKLGEPPKGGFVK